MKQEINFVECYITAKVRTWECGCGCMYTHTHTNTCMNVCLADDRQVANIPETLSKSRLNNYGCIFISWLPKDLLERLVIPASKFVLWLEGSIDLESMQLFMARNLSLIFYTVACNFETYVSQTHSILNLRR